MLIPIKQIMLSDADFATTAIGKKNRKEITIADIVEGEDDEYTMDQQLREEASLGII